MIHRIIYGIILQIFSILFGVDVMATNTHIYVICSIWWSSYRSMITFPHLFLCTRYTHYDYKTCFNVAVKGTLCSLLYISSGRKIWLCKRKLHVPRISIRKMSLNTNKHIFRTFATLPYLAKGFRGLISLWNIITPRNTFTSYIYLRMFFETINLITHCVIPPSDNSGKAILPTSCRYSNEVHWSN